MADAWGDLAKPPRMVCGTIRVPAWWQTRHKGCLGEQCHCAQNSALQHSRIAELMTFTLPSFTFFSMLHFGYFFRYLTREGEAGTKAEYYFLQFKGMVILLDLGNDCKNNSTFTAPWMSGMRTRNCQKKGCLGLFGKFRDGVGVKNSYLYHYAPLLFAKISRTCANRYFLQGLIPICHAGVSCRRQ